MLSLCRSYCWEAYVSFKPAGLYTVKSGKEQEYDYENEARYLGASKQQFSWDMTL